MSQDESLSDAVPAYQVAVDSGDTEKAKFLQSFIEDHFEELWTQHRDHLLELSLPALSAVLSSDRLNIEEEATVWLVIENWINARRAERQQHLPLLFKQCLRFGRLRPLFIQHILLRSSVYLDMSAEAHEEVKQHVAQVFALLTGTGSQEAIIDVRGLLYHKDIVHFRPRDPPYLLIVAGGNTPEYTPIRKIEVYNGHLDKWRTIALTMPSIGSFLEMQFLNGAFYVFGSSVEAHQRTLLALDLTQAEPTWREKCPMLEAKYYLSSVVLDGHLYALGGSGLKTCERYLPALDRWEAIADLHYGRAWPSATTFKGRIYIAGGRSIEFPALASVEVYTPQSNTWLLVSPMATARLAFSLVPYGNGLWAIGGQDAWPGRADRNCESYDPQTDTWRQEENLTGWDSRAITFNGQLILARTRRDRARIVEFIQKYDPENGWTSIGGTEGVLGEGVPLSQGRHSFHMLSVPNSYQSLRP